MSIELAARVVVVVSALSVLVSVIKFISNFSVLDNERWLELGKPYFSNGGHNVYVKEIAGYHKLGKVKALRVYSRVYRICGLITLGAIIIGGFSQHNGI
ncbi:hypothetical protein [Pseudoteredinibacter isoporae]|uniref:hypothetical protein n=1 Tax=Pseudoteredinibacter isoporae TaxID=570281 RepID=UPI00310AA555